MNRVNEMISALRKCAKEHENEVVCTGQIRTSSLCKDVADYLETDQWHYPSRGEYPTEGEEVFVAWTSEGSYDVVKFKHDRWGMKLSPPYAWQYIVPPKEEA